METELGINLQAPRMPEPKAGEPKVCPYKKKPFDGELA